MSRSSMCKKFNLEFVYGGPCQPMGQDPAEQHEMRASTIDTRPKIGNTAGARHRHGPTSPASAMHNGSRQATDPPKTLRYPLQWAI